MPIYEYRCPNGHLFEVFKGMHDPAPAACEVCQASPLEIVLHPVAIHYKGSGFYSTDYGKGGGRKPKDEGSSGASTSGDSGSSSDSGGGEKKPDKPSTDTKKAAEA